jgi:hypothetical protein
MAIGNNDLVSETAANAELIAQQANHPDKTQRENYTSVLRKGPYAFCEDTYFGSGGYIDARYLIPYDRELFYDGRRELAFLKNFYQSIVNATIQPVFNDPIKREVKVAGTVKQDGYFINEFILNADNSGMELQAFIDETLLFANVHGVTFVVVDNFRESPVLKSQALEYRIFPYVYLKKVTQLETWQCDNSGNIVWIQFIEDSVKDDKGNEQKRWSKWTSTTYELLGKNEKGEYVVLEVYTHGLQELPVIPVFAAKRRDRKNLKVEPPFYDIARINHAIFNKDSEIRDQERAQAFGILYAQGIDSKAMNVGLHNFINLGNSPEVTIAPDYASPDPAILTGLVNNNKELREDLFRIAGQKGVVGSERKSGVSYAWEFVAQESILKAQATLASQTEYKIIHIFQLYTSEDFEYTVTYKLDYKPDNKETNLTNYDKVLMLPEQSKIAKVILNHQAFIENSEGVPEEELKKEQIVYERDLEEATKQVEADNAGDDDVVPVEEEEVEVPA